MNPFTRAPQLTDSDWRPDGTGVEPNGDAVGGDIQRGESYSVRFIRPDRPRSLVTVSFYATESDNNPGEYGVQRQVEWLVCEDPNLPGDTEVWSDDAYDDISYEVIDTRPKPRPKRPRTRKARSATPTTSTGTASQIPAPSSGRCSTTGRAGGADPASSSTPSTPNGCCAATAARHRRR